MQYHLTHLRNNSQKLDEEVIRRFQQTFPYVGQRPDSKFAPESGTFNTRVGDPAILSGVGVDMVDSEYKSNSDDDMKLCSEWTTPQDSPHLSFPSPWMDLGPMSTMPASQHFGFNTPSSCKLREVLHNQAGDLHTPTTGVNIITPLPLSNVTPVALHNFRGNDFEQCDPPLFDQRLPDLNPDLHQTAYAPSSFMHRDSGNAAHSEYVESSLPDEMQLALASNAMSSTDFCDQTSTSCAKDEK